MPSLTIENYVKSIYQIGAGQNDQPAATGQIAASLGVSPGTVTSMLKTLSESGLAKYTRYEGVCLTSAGRALALRVLRRHRLIELFLAKTLELSWDEVHEEAENMEHAVSDRLIDRIDAFLEFPAADPHGDPIPKADGTLSVSQAHSLAVWQIGHSFRLVRVLDQSPEFLRYLSDHGLPLGTEGRVQENCDSAGIVTVTIDNKATTISREVAEKLLVSPPGARQVEPTWASGDSS
ncbi:MAG: metal-dependent transcriptional regulator [Pirellulaceae bacterium]|nr:metal-dependent transcriptional regulator [Pirellulaceae bacterium]HJN12768.1 metal-dependent transcriptional regulator [Pirellulaceae bacterium]